MGDVCHGLCRMMDMLATFWPMLATLCFFYSREWVSSIVLLIGVFKAIFFNTGNVHCNLCHHLLLSATQPGTIFMLATIWAMLGMRDLLLFMLWGLLWAPKHDPSINQVMGRALALRGQKSRIKATIR
jgi:hypothetical protein